MYNTFLYIVFFILFFFVEILYFKLASVNRIIDKPNERSSHTHLTIRGGGIIFPIAVICWFFLNNYQYPFFFLGLLLISIVSFIDDIKSLHTRIRFLIQFIAAALLLYQIQLDIDWYWYILFFISVVGIINSWNFMDGINGITGSYSLTALITFWYINHFQIVFTSEPLLILLISSLLVFIFFNFRKQAKCFAGDIGSISIAFVICFLLLQLIQATGVILFAGFLLVYGLDALTTILFRLIRKENILEAHRSHFYQYLVNEKEWPHLGVSMMYSVLQAVFNVVIIILFSHKNVPSAGFLLLISIIVVTAVLFIILRIRVEGYSRLLHS